MTLHQAIELVLNRKGVPMTPWELERELVISEDYLKKDLTKPNAEQIVLRIRKYPHLFQIVNGYVINVRDEDLITLVKSVNRIKVLLGDVFSFENTQLLIASFLFFKRISDKEEVNFSFIDSLINFDFFKQTNSLGYSIFYELENQFKRLGNPVSSDIYNLLFDIETAQYDDERFASIFEFIIYNLSAEKSSFKNSSPEFIRNLLPQLADRKIVMKVFDPTAGMGGILTSTVKSFPNVEIYGTEINIQSAVIGNLNLYLHGYQNKPIQERSFFQVEYDRYDFIVADFPISGVTYKNIGETGFYFQNLQSNGRGFASLVTKCYELLSANGKAVVTIADSFLTKRGIDQETRRFLVMNNIIETIISLPAGSYKPYSNTKMSILILNKRKPERLRNKIRFIRATPIESSKNSVVVDIEKIIEEYLYFNENTAQNIIEINDFDEDFNLTAERNSPQHLIRKIMLKEGRAFFLEAIADVKGGIPKSHLPELPIGVPYIKIEDLDEEVLDIKLKVKGEFDFTSNDYFTLSKYAISKPCILISTVGKKTKTNIYYPTPEVPYILTSSNIVSIIVQDNFWNLDYVYFQLNSFFVIDQINSFRKGDIIPYFSLKDIKKILIPYAESAAQKYKIDQQKSEIIFKEESNGAFKLTKEHVDKEKEQTELDLVRTITHQLKHMLTTVHTHVEKIKRITEVNKLGEMKEYVADDSILEEQEGFEAAENRSLNEVIVSAYTSTLLLNQILDDVKRAIHLELELNTYSIKDVMQEVSRSYPYIDIKITGSDVEVKLSKSHIVDVFRTLICNSIEHSFRDIRDGRIMVNIKLLTDVVILEYHTNGSAIKITEREYKSIATKSTNSRGTGMGGYYIDKVIHAHNGKLRIKENLKTGVKIEIEIPILNDYE
ncbi:N-6 DNA methylase [Sphingobacterium pedocola]|uniref:site-specific DNA-methyltransferase (adenine-specific) n=1 Tax=Sphingobacterium pedocola TaxID=2082722 RepID=A0ABR9T2S0_9SPHI|nr:N-6 DNA methylase [Sphingobacterium pedocola]MBE8719651.1 hypothetical protein [Sphingobacterium pedocola]